jgi:lysophospholipase L1-like esterase
MARLKRGDDGAYEDLRAAMEGDPLPLRATRAMTDAVRAAAERSGARLVDLEAQAERDHGAPPPAWFTDVVHLSAKGHVVLAEALLPVVQEELAPNARTSPPR